MKKTLTSSIVITLFISLFISAPSAYAADSVVNGTFSAADGGWIGASFSGSGNDACPGGQPNIGTWGTNALTFSYIRNEVYQDVVITKPGTVTLNYTVQNRPDQQLTQWFSADFGSSTTGNIRPGTIAETKTLSFTTTTANQVVRIAFTGQDGSFWAGCYATQVSNVFLSFPGVAIAPEPEKIFLPNDLVQTSKPGISVVGEFVTCGTGGFGYRNTRNQSGTVEKVDLDSLTLLVRVDGVLVASASSDNYVNLPKWVFGVTASSIDAKIVNSSATWVIPGVNLRSKVVCEVAAYKEHQILYSLLF